MIKKKDKKEKVEEEKNPRYESVKKELEDGKLTAKSIKYIRREILGKRRTVSKTIYTKRNLSFFFLFYTQKLLITLYSMCSCCKNNKFINNHLLTLKMLSETKRKTDRLQDFISVAHSVHRANVVANTIQTPE